MLSTITHSKPVQNLESADGNCRSNKFVTDCLLINPDVFDTVDNPELRKLIGGPDESQESIFQTMKYECNRLYSYRNKWPVNEISPESLAGAGFFYLQHEDKVQCPFCCVVIYNWTSIDKPLREHMKKSPKCQFLMGCNVGNIPLKFRHHQQIPKKPVHEMQFSTSTTNVNYKPKHPRMADIKRRLLTYSGWKLTTPSSRQLAECGLYYSGVADVVVCFLCGGSLGNWESDDDPWAEHSKFFPDCAFLSLHKSRAPKSNIIVGSCGMEAMKPKSNSAYELPPRDITSEVVKEALNIFPKPMVLEAIKHKNGSIFSLQDLCDDILQMNQKKKNESTLPVISNGTLSDTASENTSFNSDALLCKICMDLERGVVFQPCGHLVSCWKCAQLISDCPVCRRPIINVIRTYFS